MKGKMTGKEMKVKNKGTGKESKPPGSKRPEKMSSEKKVTKKGCGY
jgi:hypothetical protein